MLAHQMIIIIIVLIFSVGLSAQVQICHPPDEVKAKPLGRSARIEWIFEQPDTMLRYANGVPAGIWTYGKNKALGVVFNLENYPGATLEEIDFAHYSTESVPGDLFYKIHIYDMENNTIIKTIDSIKATNSYPYPQYEVAVPLGSINYLNRAGIFIQGLSNNQGSNLYFPCPMTDDQKLVANTSFWCNDTNDPFNNLYELSLISPSSTNLNINLWINFGSGGLMVLDKGYNNPEQSTYAPPISFEVTEDFILQNPLAGFISAQSTNRIKNLSSQAKGFNIYRSLSEDSLQLIGSVDFDKRVFEDSQPNKTGSYYYAVSSFQDSAESKRIRVQYTQPEIWPISEAKIDQNNDYIPDNIDQTVMVIGVITSPNFSLNGQYFLQDKSAGLLLQEENFAIDLNLGDSVAVIGKIKQYHGLTAIEPESAGDAVILNSANPLDTLKLNINQIDESYEGMLVSVLNVKIINPENWPAQGSDGSGIIIFDGRDTLEVMIDKETELDGWTPPSGHIHLVGLVDQNSQNSPPDDNYRIRPRYVSDFIILTEIEKVDNYNSLTYLLEQNYPNPFNASTLIEFSLPKATEIKLSLFNILGQKVIDIIEGPMPAGIHQIKFEATDLPSGIYFYKIVSPLFNSSRKMILMR